MWPSPGKNIFIPVVALFIVQVTLAQPESIQKRKASVQHRIDTYLDKEKKLGGFYALTDSAFLLYASGEMKAKQRPERTLLWSELVMTRTDSIHKKGSVRPDPTGSYASAHPLSNIRIALDPGHIAGTLESGKIEQKYLQIHKDSLHGIPEDIELVEGHLTLGTALVLRQKLEEAGATVMMTHSKPDETALGISFEEWRKHYLNQALDSLVNCKSISPEQRVFYKTKADKRRIFKDIFRDIELQKRADLINAFHPDITVIIHYNVDEKNTDWKRLTDKNFVMAFIGGSMLPSELNKPEKRADFMLLAVTNDLNESEVLAGSVVKSFSETLHVPIVEKSQATYLRDNCLATSHPGVYCRNLILTRIIHTPLVYGETLYQDNRVESINLMKEDGETGSVRNSARVRQVADAYLKGILDYFSKQSPGEDNGAEIK